MLRKLIYLVLFIMTAWQLSQAQTQTWFKIAKDGDSISIPSNTKLQYGALAGTPWGCGGTHAPLATTVWVTPTIASPTTVSPFNLGVPDPANCYVKELDVLETSTVQIVKVNGISITVPATSVVVVTPPPITTSTIKMKLTCNGNPISVILYTDNSWEISSSAGSCTAQ